MTLGIHHITMIAGDAQQNVDFYAGTLGMRPVKVSVNQDDPGTYHFFYGDATGTPGSGITYFPYPGGRQARLGSGMVGEIRLAVPKGSIPFWQARFAERGVAHVLDVDAFGAEGLRFVDPDGLDLRLVETEVEAGTPWNGMLVPADKAVLKSMGATLLTATATGNGLDSKTGSFIEKHLGFTVAGEAGNTRRYVGQDGSYVDVEVDRARPFGSGGHGGVHHIAFRVATFEEQKEIHAKLVEAGAHVSDLIDRLWFRSIYFREPGGVLFEIATDGPGYTADESADTLGRKLSLPDWLEPRRAAIEAGLPVIKWPAAEAVR